MKAIYTVLAVTLLAASANAQVHVQGHYRKDGTYVQPHFRSAPDNNQYNNYSSQGNSNPYTGQQGHIQPQPSFQLDHNVYNRSRVNCSQYDPNC